MKLESFVNIYYKKLCKVGVLNAKEEIRKTIDDVLNISISKQLTQSLYLNSSDKYNLKKILDRRIKKEPPERIFKKKVFRDINIFLEKKVFSPRRETEILVDIILENKINTNKTLELGTGSGAITLSLAKNRPCSKFIATDISLDCLELAKKNADNNNLLNQINFICCNWYDIFVNSDFDLIISNPPYIRTKVISKLDPEVKFYDPHIALDGGKDGLDCYRKILSGLSQKLNSNTNIIFEIGYDQAEAVSILMKEAKIMNTKIYKDYSNNPRFILGTRNKNLG